jgi:hypothetical protein
MRGSKARLVTTAIVAASRFPFPRLYRSPGTPIGKSIDYLDFATIELPSPAYSNSPVQPATPPCTNHPTSRAREFGQGADARLSKAQPASEAGGEVSIEVRIAETLADLQQLADQGRPRTRFGGCG